MKNTITPYIYFATFLLTGCTPTMDLSMKSSNIDSSETHLELHFKFERKMKKTKKPLAIQRVWIYKDGTLVIDMEKNDDINNEQHSWDFPSTPKGFKITFPENLNAFPSFSKKDHLKFEFLAGGSYSKWEYIPNP